MTIFTTHDCCFTTFKRLLVARVHGNITHLNCLNTITVEALLDNRYEVAATTLSWVSYMKVTF